jgi:tetratricopeptide (TPR) repeat protein
MHGGLIKSPKWTFKNKMEKINLKMTIKKNYLILSILSLVSGAAVYPLFRNSHLLIWAVVQKPNWWGIAKIPHAKTGIISVLINSGPDFLWCLSGICLIRCLWHCEQKTQKVYLAIFYLIAIGYNVGQYFGVIPGTFDLFDLITMSGVALTEGIIFIFLSGESKMKRFVKHGITIIGIATLVFLALGSAASTPSATGVSASNKKEADELYKKGEESFKKMDYDQAITEFTEAIRLDPNNDNAYYYRAFAYGQKGDYDHAIADYDKAIQIDPKHWGWYSARGNMYATIEEYDRALADYDKAIELDPNRASVYNNRAWLYAYQLKKDFSRAISDANEALKLDPNNADYLDTRGWAYLGNGDYGKAIADFEMALRLDSDNTSLREGLTQAQLASITPEPVKDEDFEIRQNTDNTLTITNYKGTARNLVIPDTLYGLKVTVIGNSAFQNKGLISVVVPDTVFTIEKNAFYGSLSSGYNSDEEIKKVNRLIKVTLGKGLKTIGDSAFGFSDGRGDASGQLTEIIIPNSVTRIGEWAFNKAGLINVTLGTGLQSIGNYAFQGNQITEINFPSSLKDIGEYAFAYNKLRKLTISNGLQTIAPWAFQNNQIEELNFELPSSLKTIQPGTFAYNQIQSVSIPNGITVIRREASFAVFVYLTMGAFQNNPLTTVVIPASLANGNIANLSFGSINESTITRITIPAGMNENTLRGIFEDAFVNFWISQNRAGGTYVRRGPIWVKE